MDRQPDHNDRLISHVPVDMKQRTKFDAVPDLEDYTPVREIYLQKSEIDSLTKRPPKTDRDMYQCEKYLRNKWGCNEAIPGSFDPYKLDASFRSQFSTRHEEKGGSETCAQRQNPAVQPENNTLEIAAIEPQDISLQDAPPPSADNVYSRECNASHEPIPTAESELPNTDVGYESEASISDDEKPMENITQARGRTKSTSISHHPHNTSSETPERTLTPRIRSGSKPPLSRSAFVKGGGPCGDKNCQGQCKRGRERAKAPEYFPFKSRVRRSSRSRGRQP
ncbi:hypothetical protein F5Y12DRAFT_711968 [Xylaria sp. FL1777]|nr:hypothetical protein F5Y12DRAFT_711968 [Xylaria sp. FL1777]